MRRLVAATTAVAVLLTVGLPAAAAPAPPAGTGGWGSGSGVAAAAVADAVLVGAGDIADCSRSGDSRTAALVASIPGTVFTAGDNVYPRGALGDFEDCYEPTWGAFRNRTRPSPGNHDYETLDALGYFAYFGSAAGDPSKGYYAYDRGAWRIYALNSNCAPVGGCGAGSPQRKWLKADLAANPRRCVLAYWHHPRFSSGEHGNSRKVRGFWTALYEAGADVIVNGHDHDYERFARQRPSGAAARDGIREFVVGTGGAERRAFARIRANSQVRNATTFGVLKLTLHRTSYDFEFIPQAGKTFTDRRTGVRCSA
jgi:hypothetical protein